MTDRSKEVFGNVQPEKVQKKAEKSKAKYARKFGDDSAADYPVRIVPNACLHPFFGVSDIRLEEGEHYIVILGEIVDHGLAGGALVETKQYFYRSFHILSNLYESFPFRLCPFG